jgi:uncharacterized membrane protein YccC
MRITREWTAVVAAVRAGAANRLAGAFRAALCVAVPLTVGAAAGHLEMGAAASFGALSVVYVPQSPYRYRSRTVAAVGAGLVLAVLLGGLVSLHPWWAVVVSGLVAGLASFVCQAVELPPPRELMLVLALLVATDVPATPAEAATRAAFAAAGAVLAWVVTMAPALWGRRGAVERQAVAAAFTALAWLLEATGSDAAKGARHGAVMAVRQARTVLRQAGAGPDDPLVRRAAAAEVLLEAALPVEVEAAGPLDTRWATAVRALADGGSGDPLPDPSAVIGGDALVRAIEEAHAVRAGAAVPIGARSLPGRPGFASRLAAALRRHSVVLPSAARFGIAVGLGVGIGRALGLGHAYWVGLTVAAVLQGSNLAVTRRRVVHRAAGTVVGVALTFAFLGWGPPVWAAVLLAVVAQFAIELVIAVHYGLAVVPITVLSLTLFHLGAPEEDIGVALGARLLDTAIGVTLALLLRRVLWPHTAALRLPVLQARLVGSIRETLQAAWTAGDPDTLPQQRRALQTELATLRAVHADALADVGDDAVADTRWPVSAAVEELAFLALALPPHRRPPPAERGRSFLDHLDALRVALATSTAPPGTSPDVPGYQRTSTAAAVLTTVVAASTRAPRRG